MQNKNPKKVKAPQGEHKSNPKRPSPPSDKPGQIEKSSAPDKEATYPNEIYEETLPPEHRLN